MKALIGMKIGMTQIFDESGNVVPVTALRVEPNVVVGLRAADRAGYDAVVLGAIAAKKSRVTKTRAGQFPEGVEPRRYLREIKDLGVEVQVGASVGLEIFEGVEYVDVQGISKGKGFQGVVKKHGMKGGPGAHGTKFGREVGSTGMRSTPGKVFKGTHNAGRMGHATVTVENLALVRVDVEKQLLLVKGSVPGPRNTAVLVREAIKK
jgi:large subunit ribosomal protein L3